MKLKNLLALAAIALCGSANAQIGDGPYYIQNVQSGLFFAGSNSWGTQGSVNEEGDMFTLSLNNGTYTITNTFLNTGNVTLGYNLFVDTNLNQNGNQWTITPVEGKDGVYTFYGKGKKDNVADAFDGFIAQSGNIVVGVNPADETAEWRFVTKEERVAELNNVAWGSSKSATFLLSNPNFTRNHKTDAWKVSNCTNYNLAGGEASNFCAESYRSPFTISQTIDVPNGVYGVTAQGFVRSDGGKIADAVFFANEVTAAFPEKTGSENSMTDASNSFKAGLYTIEEMKVTVTNGKLEIGVKNTSSGLWCIWDNFQLTYYGIDVTALQAALASRITAAEAISGDMNSAVKSALSTAITNAKNCAATQEAIEDALTELNTAIDNAKASIEKYAAVAAMIEPLDKGGKAAFEATEIGGKYVAKTYVDEDITEALATAIKGQTSEGADFTGLIINPSFELGDMTGWTAEGNGGAWTLMTRANAEDPKVGNYWYEKYGWAGKIDVQQTITGLPAGTYTVGVKALDQKSSVKLIAKSGESTAETLIDKATAADFTVEIALEDNSDLTIGLYCENHAANTWVGFDNFTLKYSSLKFEELTACEGEMNGAIKQAQTDALAAYNAKKTIANYNAAVAAIAAAEASRDRYDAVREKVEKLDTDGWNAFKATEVGAKYANKTYVDEDITAEYIAAVKAQGVGADMTAAAPTSWEGQSGTVAAQFCPDMPGAPERYQAGAFTGDVMTMTITGLKEGTYKVVLRGGASYTSGRGFEGGTGQNRAYLFANDALYSLEVYDRTVITEGTVETAELTCGVNEDGTLKMGIQNKTMGANWFVVKLESITYMSESLPTTDVELAVSEAQYATFIAPFDAELPAGVVAYTVDGIGDDNELVMTETTIKANTPVVLFSESPVSETLTGVSEAEAATYTVGLLTGVYAPVEITAGYVLQNQEEGGVKFYAVSADNAITVPANKAYLTTTSEAKALGFPAVATAIKALTTGGVEAIYNANGVKQNKLQKGMNIIMVNGQAQKVLVK